MSYWHRGREFRTAAPAIVGKAHWPVVRLNALRVSQMPTMFRRVVCKIGGTGEVREAVATAGVDVLAARTKPGVLAFGADADIRKAFAQFDIDEFDLTSIETRRLRYDSAERGLLRDAVVRAICRHRGLGRIRRRTTDLLYPMSVDEPGLQELKKHAPALGGTVPKFPNLQWREGCAVRMEWAADSLWLLLEPGPIFLTLTAETKFAASSFGRERTFKRYNQKLDSLVDFWSSYLYGDGEEVHALGISTGVDAAFKFGQRTAFTRRAGA